VSGVLGAPPDWLIAGERDQQFKVAGDTKIISWRVPGSLGLWVGNDADSVVAQLGRSEVARLRSPRSLSCGRAADQLASESLADRLSGTDRALVRGRL
jgi:hypothetical protein